ncbi:holo-ACP synthase [Lentilactobacillus senioris]|uniref:holo-ACP synthase n=1 Tax=Lentilactobacillus senioris TaxID=931534 RepID=UPI002281C685|nr:holo-ACP synthase [Lentilactobacillus senioris]MCY9807567.1 holo-ACP synthase [Lentilactobacillus senioris]
MIVGIGVDLTEINRIATLINQHPNFLTKVLTIEELAEYQQRQGIHQLEFAAGRFSAKESYTKAYGTGIGAEVSFADICILNNEKGQPEFKYQPFAGSAFISISHTKELVMTEVILEREGR